MGFGELQPMNTVIVHCIHCYNSLLYQRYVYSLSHGLFTHSTHLVWLQSVRVRARVYVYYCPCPVLCCCGRHASRVQSQTIPGYYRTKHSAGVARLTASLCGLYSTPLHYVLPLLYHPPLTRRAVFVIVIEHHHHLNVFIMKLHTVFIARPLSPLSISVH